MTEIQSHMNDSTTNSNEDSQDESPDPMRKAGTHVAGDGPAPVAVPTPGSSCAVTAREDNHPPQAPQQKVPQQPPQQASQLSRYSVFSKRKKRSIVSAASIGAVFSTLSSQTYLPALKVLADDFNVSVSEINLTVTVYLVFQCITPMFIGGFADMLGRRPAYIILVGFITCAQLGDGTMALAIANSVFLNEASITILPDVPLQEVQRAIAGVGSSLVTGLDPATEAQVLEAIVAALSKTYVLVITAGALVTVLSLAMKREKLFIASAWAG
ncbi:hypothetical protein MMC18_006359 [Xylographa bjoerkii]|nr:hypothetical protein [Xylographa bjoerkii]